MTRGSSEGSISLGSNDRRLEAEAGPGEGDVLTESYAVMG